MFNRSMLALLLCAAGLLAGCGTVDPAETTLSAADYDQSCATDDDCVLVLEGDVCVCGCNFNAIAASEQERYSKEDAEKRGRCDEVLTCTDCPASTIPVCKAGTCAAQ